MTENTCRELLRRLGGSTDDGLESFGSGVDIGADRRKDSLECLKQQMAASSDADLDDDARGQILADATRGLEKLSSEGPDATLTEEERFGLEAIIISDGSRPVLFVQDGKIPTQYADLKGWQSKALTLEAGIRSVIRSVGRIDDPRLSSGYAGTGFVIDDGVIATNRHVLEAIGRETANGWQLDPRSRIDFLQEFERDGTNAYKLDSVIFAPPARTGLEVNFGNLDLALFRTATGPDYPPPLTLAETSDDLALAAGLYTVGYPAKPRSGAADALSRLFANTFGFKRWAPGQATSIRGSDPQDTKSWVFNHDATTLGGSSGSCVIAFSGSGVVCVGLHFSGLTGVANHAHVIAAIRSQLAIRVVAGLR